MDAEERLQLHLDLNWHDLDMTEFTVNVDGYEDCVIGTFYDEEQECTRMLISMNKLQAKVEAELADADDPALRAREHIDYNIIGSFSQRRKGHPVFVYEVEEFE